MRRTYLGCAGSIAIAAVSFFISTRLVAEQQNKTHAALRIQNPDDLKWSPVGSLPYGVEVAALDVVILHPDRPPLGPLAIGPKGDVAHDRVERMAAHVFGKLVSEQGRRRLRIGNAGVGL